MKQEANVVDVQEDKNNPTMNSTGSRPTSQTRAISPPPPSLDFLQTELATAVSDEATLEFLKTELGRDGASSIDSPIQTTKTTILEASPDEIILPPPSLGWYESKMLLCLLLVLAAGTIIMTIRIALDEQRQS